MENKLIECPYCGEIIHADAKQCRYCKRRLSRLFMKYNSGNDNKESEKYNNDSFFNNELPYQIRRFNWGAFCFNFIWGIFNNSYLTFLIFIAFFIPVNYAIYSGIVSIVLGIWFGINGNKWAWENKEWKSVEHFNYVQRKWAIAGVIFAIISLFIGLIIGCCVDLYSESENMNSNNVSNVNKLKLVESHKCISDFGTKAICGTVKNESNHLYTYAEISFNLYDTDGNLVGSTLTNINNIDAGTIWKFQAYVTEDNATSYKFTGIEGF